MVVIRGLAMTAGSKPIRWATIGSTQPIILAKVTVMTRVRQMIRAIRSGSLSSSISLTKLVQARVSPHRKATRISFQRAMGSSLNSISFRERPRMMETLAWEPALPPVSISMGM